MQGLSPTGSKRRDRIPSKAVNVYAEALEVILKGTARDRYSSILPNDLARTIGNRCEKPRPNLFRRGIDGKHISRTLMVLDENAH